MVKALPPVLTRGQRQLFPAHWQKHIELADIWLPLF
jgi:hypothetical protein